MAETRKRIELHIGEEFNPYQLFNGAFIPNWLLRREEVSPDAKLVYARLCQYAGKDGEAFPSMRGLATELGFKNRYQARRAIRELLAVKLIKVSSGKDTGERNRYRFITHEWMRDAARMPYELVIIDG